MIRASLGAPMITLSLILALVGSTSQTAFAGDRRPNTPEEAYRLDVGCAGGAAAARLRISNTGTDKQVTEAEKLADLTKQIATRAAVQMGISPHDVDTGIESQRDDIMARFKQDAAKQEKELGRFLLECALLHAVQDRTALPLPVPDHR